MPPECIIQNQIIGIKKPLLGSLKNPGLPRNLFREGCKKLKTINADELFDQIQQKNRILLVNIIRELHLLEGKTIDQLYSACLDQLEIISKHSGSN